MPSRSTRLGESFERSTVKLQKDWSNPHGLSSAKVCKLQNIETKLGASEYRKDTVHLVSISLPAIPRDARKPKGNGENFPLEHKVMSYTRTFSDALFNEYKECLDIAVNELKADIICINELGMPLRADGRVRTEARVYAKKIADKHNCLIIGGSNHDVTNYLNIGYLIYPGRDLHHGKEFLEFYKNISAVQVSERIFTPSDRIILTTSAFGLGISFVICLELVDYATSALIAAKRETVDLLIVPTYVGAEFGIMAKVAQGLSQVIGGVLLTNCYSNRDNPSSKLILNGNEFIRADEDKECYSSSIRSKVVLRRIDVRKLKSNKVESNKNLPDELKCLYSLDPAGLDIR